MAYLFAFDRESTLAMPGCQVPPSVCYQYQLSETTPTGIVILAREVLHVKDPRAKQMLAWALANATMSAHFAAFDMSGIGADFPDLLEAVFAAYDANRVTCTSLREMLADIGRGFPLKAGDYGLAGCIRKHFKRIVAKGEETWRTRYGELYNLPVAQWPDDAVAYCLDDVQNESDLYYVQEEKYRASGFLADEYRQARAQFWLHLSGAWGVVTDPEGVAKLLAETKAETDKDRAIAQAAGLVRADGTKDTKAAMARMCRVMMGLGEEIPLTDGGRAALDRGEASTALQVFEKLGAGISLDEDACLASGDDVLEAYQRYGSKTTLFKRVQRLTLGYTLPLQPKYNSLVETGRTSCTQGDDEGDSRNGVQVQNLPRKGAMRGCFVPRKGDYTPLTTGRL